MSNISNLVNTTIPMGIVFKTRVNEDGENFVWKDVSTKDIFAGKKVVVFSLPGAFTPTCSSTHLPGYESNYKLLKDQGIDEVYCLSVNDSFVMNAWAKDLNISKVKMLPDGNADLTRALGMLVKKENLGFGERSWRYSMYVEDGVIKQVFAEEGFADNFESDPFEVSDATTMLNYLKTK